VLVVDDSDAQRRAVRRELSDMNVELIEATSGIGALQQALSNHIDLVTLDIEMKDFDGYRVLRQLRAGKRTRGTPVIMVSGRPSDEERFRAQAEGAIAYFAKPFEPGSLRQLVSEIVTRVSTHRRTMVGTIAPGKDLGERLARMVSAQGYRFRSFESVAELAPLPVACDVLLLDLHLPDQGAYRALDALQALPENQRPRVLGVMSDSTPADLAHAFHRGLSDFVRMPFCAEELTARIEHLVTLRRETDALQTLVTTDALTGLPNRAYLDRETRRASARAEAGGTLGIVMIDIDHFKRLNDGFGHPFGDVVLRAVAERLRDCLRGNDVVGRYGGEEFMALVPNATQASMELITERLRRSVESMTIETEGKRVPVTASFGSCIWDALALGHRQLGELAGPADAALYEAKRAGRNRACLGPVLTAA
jgi:two-component system cell cycle response regulator